MYLLLYCEQRIASSEGSGGRSAAALQLGEDNFKRALSAVVATLRANAVWLIVEYLMGAGGGAVCTAWDLVPGIYDDCFYAFSILSSASDYIFSIRVLVYYNTQKWSVWLKVRAVTSASDRPDRDHQWRTWALVAD